MNGGFHSRAEFLNTAGAFLELAWNHPESSVAILIKDGHLTFMIPGHLKDELAAGIIAGAPDADIKWPEDNELA
jgi:hypothetical protein